MVDDQTVFFIREGREKKKKGGERGGCFSGYSTPLVPHAEEKKGERHGSRFTPHDETKREGKKERRGKAQEKGLSRHLPYSLQPRLKDRRKGGRERSPAAPRDLDCLALQKEKEKGKKKGPRLIRSIRHLPASTDSANRWGRKGR